MLAGGALLGFVLLSGANGPLSRLLRLDLDFLAFPVALCGLLLALGRVTVWLRDTELAERVTWRLRAREGVSQALRLSEVLPVAQRLLTDFAWTVLGLALLSSASELPGVVSDHPWAPDIASFGRYLGGFDSLAIWGVLLLAPFIAARAAAEVRPNVSEVVSFPRTRLVAFSGAYVLLAGDGALSAAFGLNGSWVLFGLGLALVFSVAALVLRRALTVALPENPRRLRTALHATEAGWVVALLGAMAALPYAVDAGPLTASYFALLFPFAVVLYAGTLRPAVAGLLGVPVAHVVLLAVVYVVFSGNGVVSRAFAIDVPGMFVALIAASVLSYGATVLRNVPKVRTPERHALLTANASRALSILILAAAIALVVGAGLAHLPVANAVLLNREGTRELGESFLPFLGGFYEARYSIALLSFMATAMLLLPRVLEGHTFLRYEPLLSAVSYFAVGCLTWLTATGLSAFGHGFTFAGAIAAAGMLSLALTRLARYATASRNPAIADIAVWLATSQVRGFILGAALAFYVLLLRPVVYEVLWFAPLYEYTALLVLLLAVLMNVVNKLRLVADAPESAEPVWSGWSHHQQVLESKPDPRAELADALRQRFVNRGDWKPLWAYLFGLLYRSGASLDAMVTVCRSLRRGAVAPPVWDILGRSSIRSKRLAALEHVLDTAGWALASPVPQPERVNEDDARTAAASFVDRGTDPEALAVALTVAQCQRGEEPEEAVVRWFALLDTPNPFLERLTRPWGRSNTRVGATLSRFNLVNTAMGSLFEDATDRGLTSRRGPAEGRERGRR